MRDAWKVVLVIVVIAIVIGAVGAAVGLLTGADLERINSALTDRAENQFNVDPHAFIFEWIPESAKIIFDAVFQ